MSSAQEERRAQALQQVSDERLEAAVQQGLNEARSRQAAPGLAKPLEQDQAQEQKPSSSEPRELETSNK